MSRETGTDLPYYKKEFPSAKNKTSEFFFSMPASRYLHRISIVFDSESLNASEAARIFTRDKLALRLHKCGPVADEKLMPNNGQL